MEPEKKINEELELAISLNQEKLQKSRIYTVERVKQELTLLNMTLHDLEIDEVKPEKKNKKCYFVEALIKARKELKKANPDNWEEDLQGLVRHRLKGSQRSALEIINEELKNSFFTFAGTESLESIGKTNVSFDLEDGEDDDYSAAENDHQYNDECAELLLQTINDIEIKYDSNYSV